MVRRVGRGSNLRMLLVGALIFALPAAAQTPDENGGVEQTVLFENPAASILVLPKPSATRADPLALVPGTTAATPAWWDGSFTYQYFTNCLSNPPTQGYVISQAGYYGADDGSYPRVGQVYLVRIIMAVVGNNCAGGVAETNEAQLPAGTSLAVSAQNPVRCWYLAPGAQNWVDATNDPGAGCPTNPGQGTYLPINLGTRAVPNYSQFAIHVPVYSTRVLSGIGDSSNSTLTMMAYSLSTSPAQVLPYQWVWVFDNPPTIDTLAAVNITGNSARTQGWVRNHYKAGNVYFDIGETTAYGFTAGPYSLAATYDAASVYQDWGLDPGTTYHWRMRFVPTSGTAVASTDQVFTTTGTTPAPSGLVATAVSTSQVNLSWLGVLNADHYNVWRSFNGEAFAVVGTASGTSFIDPNVVADKTYFYRVQAVDAQGSASPFSLLDPATTVFFDDDPLVPNTTTIKLIHMTKLRTAVNAMRVSASLSPLVADSSVAAGSPVRAQHVADVRTGLSEARTAAGLPALTFTDAALTPGSTPVKAVHAQQLRDGVK